MAAPALAAVAGTAMTTVGGASAAAAVTGIMGSSVGAAAVIAGFGAGGAHVVGGKMARRIGAPCCCLPGSSREERRVYAQI